MKIRKVMHNKKEYMELLLLADEQEDMIDRYLERGDMFVLEDGGVLAECVVTREGDGVYELKNIAVAPDCQRKGYGKQLIEFAFSYYGDCERMLVGTGDVDVYKRQHLLRPALIRGPGGRKSLRVHIKRQRKVLRIHLIVEFQPQRALRSSLTSILRRRRSPRPTSYIRQSARPQQAGPHYNPFPQSHDHFLSFTSLPSARTPDGICKNVRPPPYRRRPVYPPHMTFL